MLITLPVQLIGFPSSAALQATEGLFFMSRYGAENEAAGWIGLCVGSRKVLTGILHSKVGHLLAFPATPRSVLSGETTCRSFIISIRIISTLCCTWSFA